MPILIKSLGTERFGVLTLIWMVIGYFSLFDLGLSRALTLLVAENLGKGRIQKIPALIWTSLCLMLILGVIGAFVIRIFSRWLVYYVISMPEELRMETLRALNILSISIPIVIVSSGLRGILMAYQRFDLTNIVRVLVGLFTLLGPLIVLFFTTNLFWIVIVLVVGRIISCIVHLVFCLRTVPLLKRGIKFQKGNIGLLIRFGGWMTISNLISPLLVYIDRFLIGALLSVSSVAYYVTPSEVVTKMWAIPGGLVAVLFPAFSASIGQGFERASILLFRGVKIVFIILFPITLIIVTLAKEGLDLWLGHEFALHSMRIMQWLAVGVFVNSLTQVAFVFIQGAARPDITAKLHFAELPIYLLAFWILVRLMGLEGAAVAWVGRMLFDALFIFGYALRLAGKKWFKFISKSFVLGLAVATIVAGGLIAELSIKLIYLALMLTVFVLLGWFCILVPTERAMVRRRLRAMVNFAKHK